MKVLFNLGFIVTGSETDLVCPSSSNIKFILSVLAKTMKTQDHHDKNSGYWCCEILEGIAQLASCSEQICVYLIQENFLEYASTILTDGEKFSQEEKFYTLRTCWTLSFNAMCRHSIASKPGIVDGIGGNFVNIYLRFHLNFH